MMGLPAITGNSLLDPAFYISCAVLVVFFASFFVWHLADKWRFRREHDEADQTIAAARFAADVDLTKTAMSERRRSPYAPKAGAR